MYEDIRNFMENKLQAKSCKFHNFDLSRTGHNKLLNICNIVVLS